MYDELMEHFENLVWDWHRARMSNDDKALDEAAQALEDLGAECVNGKWYYDPEDGY